MPDSKKPRDEEKRRRRRNLRRGVPRLAHPLPKYWEPDEVVFKGERLIRKVFKKDSVEEIFDAIKDLQNKDDYIHFRAQALGHPRIKKLIPWLKAHPTLDTFEAVFDRRTSEAEIKFRVKQYRRQLNAAFPPSPWRRLKALLASIRLFLDELAPDMTKKILLALLLALGGSVWAWFGLAKHRSYPEPEVTAPERQMRFRTLLNYRRANGRGQIEFEIKDAALPKEDWVVYIDGKWRREDRISDLGIDGKIVLTLGRSLPIGPHKFTLAHEGVKSFDKTITTLYAMNPADCLAGPVDVSKTSDASIDGVVGLSSQATSFLYAPVNMAGQRNRATVVTVKGGSASKDLSLYIHSPNGYDVELDFAAKTIRAWRGSILLGVLEREALRSDFWNFDEDRVLCLSENGNLAYLSVLDEDLTWTYATFRSLQMPSVPLAKKLVEAKRGSVTVGTVAVSTLSHAAGNAANYAHVVKE